MTAPFFDDGTVALHLGDCLDVLRTLPDASVDAVVTDPPYELAFMGRAWDASGIAFNPATWAECLRVLKPGGHLLAFGGTRTYHRLAVAIEDAGFEIRDSIHWIYGSGFPKGQAIDKAIDRQRNDRADVLRVTTFLAAARDAAGWTTKQIDDLFGFNGMASHWTAIASKAASVPTPEQWDRLREALGFDDAPIRSLVAALNGRKGSLGEAWVRREVVGEAHRVRRESDVQIAALSTGAFPITAPATDAARRWQGWNTSLKPAHEPIVLARKSTGFNTTVANVLEHGTGALNIDACRTAVSDRAAYEHNGNKSRFGDRRNEVYGVHQARADSANGLGRWPTNVVFSHPPKIVDGEVVGDACADGCVEGCPVRELDAQSGIRPSGGSPGGTASNTGLRGNTFTRQRPERPSDNGGASRYFPQFRYSAHDRQFSLVKCPTCGDALTGDASTSVGRKTESSGGNWPTDGSGSKLTDQSPRGTRSTTETTTPSTTSCSTSCASPPSGTTITINDSAKTTNGSTVSSTDGASDAPSTSRSAASTSGERGHSTGTAENAPRHTGASGSHETATSSTLSVEPSGPLATTRSHPPFRYVAKAPASERPKLPDGTAHNTVKPLDLVRWLVRLVTPPGGTVLDPFAGSGTTGEAAVIEGFRAVLIEREAPYAELIKARLAKPISPVLDFGEEIA